MMRKSLLFLLGWFSVSTCLAQEVELPHPTPLPTIKTGPAGVCLDPPPAEPDLRVLPINLATALQLTNTRPLDVAIAAERIRLAAAGLEQARALWLPTVTIGGDYNRHDGPIQAIDGTIVQANRSSAMFGLGTGIGQAAVFNINDAIFAPLAARQVVHVRQADLQAASNNTMVAVTDAYFNVEQARGELAGAIDTARRTGELVERLRKLAPGLVAPLEVTRAEAELARRQEAETSARERWQVAGAELLRVLRLDATAQVIPLEPPHLQVTLVDLNQCVDNLVELGLMNRPELVSYQAQVKATLAMLRQEKFRPLIPSVLLRGWSTPVTGTLGVGYFAGGTNSSIGNGGIREDFDFQLLWQLDNLGFGNRARIHQRKSELQVVTLELFRMQDRVAAEVAQAFAQARNSCRRAEIAEREVKLSLESYEKNLIGLGQTRRAGEIVQTVVRPQEVVAAVQALAQSYVSFYLAVADSNRAQFRLYRAMGQPAQALGGFPDAPDCCPPAAPPSPPSTTIPPTGG